jgi:hypothetical protein
LRQEGSDCALQGDAAGMEGCWFGGKGIVLQLHRMTEEDNKNEDKC